MRLAARTGSIAPGKDADVILLHADNLTVFPADNPVGTIVAAGHPGQGDLEGSAGRAGTAHATAPALLPEEAPEQRAERGQSHSGKCDGHGRAALHPLRGGGLPDGHDRDVDQLAKGANTKLTATRAGIVTAAGPCSAGTHSMTPSPSAAAGTSTVP